MFSGEPMTYEQALARLRNHSDLEEQGAEDESLLFAITKAGQADLSNLTRLLHDVLACLAVANLELNGPRPSEASEQKNPDVISDLAYPVNGLIVGLLSEYRLWKTTSQHHPAATLDFFRDAALRIAMAWDMVLAGDIDDLIRELELEWSATF